VDLAGGRSRLGQHGFPVAVPDDQELAHVSGHGLCHF
jgi:hypothetical protein